MNVTWEVFVFALIVVDTIPQISDQPSSLLDSSGKHNGSFLNMRILFCIILDT